MPTKQHLKRKSVAKPIFDEKGFPRGKTQSETGEAVEVSAFVPWGALSTLSTRSISRFGIYKKIYPNDTTFRINLIKKTSQTYMISL